MPTSGSVVECGADSGDGVDSFAGSWVGAGSGAGEALVQKSISHNSLPMDEALGWRPSWEEALGWF